MNAEYIFEAMDADNGLTCEITIQAPSLYRAKLIAKRHCEQHDLEFVAVRLNTDT